LDNNGNGTIEYFKINSNETRPSCIETYENGIHTKTLYYDQSADGWGRSYYSTFNKQGLMTSNGYYNAQSGRYVWGENNHLSAFEEPYYGGWRKTEFIYDPTTGMLSGSKVFPRTEAPTIDIPPIDI